MCGCGTEGHGLVGGLRLVDGQQSGRPFPPWIFLWLHAALCGRQDAAQGPRSADKGQEGETPDDTLGLLHYLYGEQPVDFPPISLP